MYSKLQYISRGNTAFEQLDNIKQALDGGCQWIQLRFKNSDDKELGLVAELIKPICKSYSAILIINDHVEVAKRIDADGVHLGLNDLSIATARQILGESKIIGGTANTLEDVYMRANESCDYIGLGPFRFTSTKDNLSPILGLEGYQKITGVLSQQKIGTPIYAIGGIKFCDLKALTEAGMYGVAMSGTITYERDKKKLIEEINTILK